MEYVKLAAQRKTRLPKYRPKSNGDNGKFLDYVTRAALKYDAVGSEDRHNPQVAIVQVQAGSNRKPFDMYDPPNVIDIFDLNPNIKLTPAGKKYCSRCGDWVDCKGFSADKRNRDGLQSHCKSCHAAHERQMYWLRKQEQLGRAA